MVAIFPYLRAAVHPRFLQISLRRLRGLGGRSALSRDGRDDWLEENSRPKHSILQLISVAMNGHYGELQEEEEQKREEFKLLDRQAAATRRWSGTLLKTRWAT
jgi:hypothetical protein